MAIKIAGTTVIDDSRNIVAGLGTAGAPSLTFTGDPNTGIWSPAADTVAASTAGSERLRITSAGLVGIGTSSPGAPLQVVGATSGDQFRIGTNTTEYYKIGRDVSSGKLTFDGVQQSYSGYDFKIYPSAGGASTSALVIKEGSGNVGIGTVSPAYALDIASTDTTAGIGYALRLRQNATAGASAIQFTDNPVTTQYGYIAGDSSSNLKFATGLTEKARIDSSGRLLVGMSTARNTYLAAAISAGINVEAAGNLGASNRSISVVNGFSSSTDGDPILYLGRTRSDTIGGTTVVQNADGIGRIAFVGSDGTNMLAAAQIRAEVDGTVGINSMPGRLVFSTTAGGASTPTERMRIRSDGNVGIGIDPGTGNQLSVLATGSGERAITGSQTNASFADHVILLGVSRTASTAFNYLIGYNEGATDVEFVLRGDGNGLCDGAWTGGGADYAEYLEWSDSNPDEEDRRGISVVLDGDKIREAQAGEDPIGVISGNPSVVGDAAWNKWSGKYLRDEFGTYIQEDYEVEDEDGNTVIQQRRKLNPAYDPDVEYIPREQRPEWDCVGLMGKLRIRKGQPTGSRWIKMRDISDSVEEWLVR